MSGKQIKRLRKLSRKLAGDTGQNLLPEMQRFQEASLYKALKKDFAAMPQAERGEVMARYGKYYLGA